MATAAATDSKAGVSSVAVAAATATAAVTISAADAKRCAPIILRNADLLYRRRLFSESVFALQAITQHASSFPDLVVCLARSVARPFLSPNRFALTSELVWDLGCSLQVKTAQMQQHRALAADLWATKLATVQPHQV